MKRIFIYQLILIFCLFNSSVSLTAQMTITPSNLPPSTPENLITNDFLGPGVAITNVTYNGDPLSVGVFDNAMNDIGIEQGFLISTGFVNTANGPVDCEVNGNCGNSGGGISGNTLGDSDPDLVTLLNGIQIQDAAVYEIEFVPSTDTLVFEYVFASEEYPEFICQFNDAFGFFLSGPGINGPYTDGAENIALIPGTTDIVSVDNINDDLNCVPDPSYIQYYNSNPAGSNIYLEFDGFTDVMQVKVPVVPSGSYKLKLAVGDAFDSQYDTGVFIKLDASSNIYVDHMATGNNDGRDWANAFTNLKDALTNGANKTIHIAKGTYTPYNPAEPGVRGQTFSIPTGVTLLGGYPNGGGAREPSVHVTNLSGEVDGVPEHHGNSYHVVTVQGVSSVVLDGLTIKEGNADNANSFGRSRGGGIYIIDSEIILRDVRFRWNRAIYGGAMFASVMSHVTIEDSDFKSNLADYGSAIYHSNETELFIERTKIYNNNSLVRCAIEVNNSLYTSINNSLIANNKSQFANAIGLIATNRDQSMDINNTTILGEAFNRALITMQIGFGDQLDVNCNNTIIAHQDVSFNKNVVVFNNNILNFNTTNCYVQGSSIVGNANNNLYSSTSGDLMLNADYSVDPCSPVVDAGNDAFVMGTTDINGNIRMNNTVDIGAFESQGTCPGLLRNSMEEINTQNISVLVYPNPTAGSFKINVPNNKTWIARIYDALGEEVLITTNNENDINHLSSGLYFIQVESEGEILHAEKLFKL